MKINVKRACVLVLALLCAFQIALGEAPATDRAGNPVTLPATVETIVSLAPSITQTLIDLGVADRLVAVDSYSAGNTDVPEGLAVFDMMVPDMEQILALSPDLVLTSDMMLVDGENQLAPLTDLGICVAYIPSSDSIEGIVADTLFIGETVGEAEAAQALCDALLASVDDLRARAGAGEPFAVYFEISPAPYLYSTGSGTFLDEMIEVIGGVNIFADQESWIPVSEEAVVAANPDVIFTNCAWDENAVENILARPGWETVSAVQAGNVFLIDADASSQPNHRIVLALTQMAEAAEAAGE